MVICTPGDWYYNFVNGEVCEAWQVSVLASAETSSTTEVFTFFDVSSFNFWVPGETGCCVATISFSWLRQFDTPFASLPLRCPGSDLVFCLVGCLVFRVVFPPPCGLLVFVWFVPVC